MRRLFMLNPLDAPLALDTLLLSLKVLTLAGFLHVALGLPVAYTLSFRFKTRSLLEGMIMLPLVFPPVALGYFLLVVFGKRSPLGAFLSHHLGIEVVFGFWGVLIAALLAGFPLFVRPVQSAIESLPRELVEASYTLGKGRVETFFRVILPLVKKSVTAGVALAVGRGLGEVGMTLMLGGNISGKTETASLAVYNAVLDGNFKLAFWLSCLLGVFSLGIFWVLRKSSKTL